MNKAVIFYRGRLEISAAGRGGTANDIGAVAEFAFGPKGIYVAGSDLLTANFMTAR